MYVFITCNILCTSITDEDEKFLILSLRNKAITKNTNDSFKDKDDVVALKIMTIDAVEVEDGRQQVNSEDRSVPNHPPRPRETVIRWPVIVSLAEYRWTPKDKVGRHSQESLSYWLRSLPLEPKCNAVLQPGLHEQFSVM